MDKRIIISGGGTGGHVFPAISIADALRSIDRNVIIHFVGANGRLEMTRVPSAGYEISGLPITGFERKMSLKNIYLVVKLIKSLNKARKIISSFKPDVVVGVGGYASGPVLRVAQKKGLPTLIQEQNSYAGMTNKLLAKKAKVICVAYEGMEKYFPAEKIRLTGNPVRKDLAGLDDKKKEACEYFNLEPSLPVVLALGGSGGSRTINDSLAACLPELEKNSVQLIWQTGRFYYDRMKEQFEKSSGKLARLHDFIDRMDLAYAAADIVVSRAGACTISELSLVGLPAILVPSPNVADDHQTKNAKALIEKNAALMIGDSEAGVKLGDTIIELVNDTQKQKKMSENIASMAFSNADQHIAEEILKLAELGERIGSAELAGSVGSAELAGSVGSAELKVPRSLLRGESMIDFKKISNIWFIGIGGIGMSALARYFAEGGFKVAGYDRTESSLTSELVAGGIKVIYSDDPEEIPGEYLNREKTLVIYTPAISPVNKISAYFRTSGYSIYKRSEILGHISKKGRTIAIAGTHGKTSLTSLTAHLLKQSAVDCTAFLGGISKNYLTNMLSGTGDIIVMEADEYDRSFHQLNPEMALITSMDADHLDIYGSYENMVKAYREFTERIKEGGKLVINKRIAGSLAGPGNVQVYTYGLNPPADFYAGEISVEKEAYRFCIHSPMGKIDDLSLLIPGKMNVENSIGAVALAKLAGVKDDDIRKALIYYRGVTRRFDVRISSDELIYIDDYAHHPAEIDYCIESIREFYGKKKISGIFQPHLFTRTRDHADAFAAALDKLDRLVLLPVYPAREEAIKGVDSRMIFDRMKLKDKILAGKDEVLEILGTGEIEILLTMGAGDIDRLVEPIENLLKKRL